MTISKPVRETKTPKKKENQDKEKKAKEIINRGGSSPKPEKIPSKKKPGRPKKEATNLLPENTSGKFEMKSVQLRLYASKLDEIDNIIRQFQLKEMLPPTYSRHAWFEEAVDEKLKRDTKTLTNT